MSSHTLDIHSTCQYIFVIINGNLFVHYRFERAAKHQLDQILIHLLSPPISGMIFCPLRHPESMQRDSFEDQSRCGHSDRFPWHAPISHQHATIIQLSQQFRSTFAADRIQCQLWPLQLAWFEQCCRSKLFLGQHLCGAQGFQIINELRQFWPIAHHAHTMHAPQLAQLTYGLSNSAIRSIMDDRVADIQLHEILQHAKGGRWINGQSGGVNYIQLLWHSVQIGGIEDCMRSPSAQQINKSNGMITDLQRFDIAATFENLGNAFITWYGWQLFLASVATCESERTFRLWKFVRNSVLLTTHPELHWYQLDLLVPPRFLLALHSPAVRSIVLHICWPPCPAHRARHIPDTLRAHSSTVVDRCSAIDWMLNDSYKLFAQTFLRGTIKYRSNRGV